MRSWIRGGSLGGPEAAAGPGELAGLTREGQLGVRDAVDRARPRQVRRAALDRQRLEVEQFAVTRAVDALRADRAALDHRRVDGLRCSEGGTAVAALHV